MLVTCMIPSCLSHVWCLLKGESHGKNAVHGFVKLTRRCHVGKPFYSGNETFENKSMGGKYADVASSKTGPSIPDCVWSKSVVGKVKYADGIQEQDRSPQTARRHSLRDLLHFKLAWAETKWKWALRKIFGCKRIRLYWILLDHLTGAQTPWEHSLELWLAWSKLNHWSFPCSESENWVFWESMQTGLQTTGCHDM